MQPIKITLPDDPTLPGVRQDFICKGFSVVFGDNIQAQKIVLDLMLELFTRTATDVPVLENGEPTGETQTVYGDWEPYRRFTATNQFSFTTQSDNSKFIDPATFDLVPAGTEGAVPELAAIWSNFGGPITQLLQTVMNRMVVRGNLNDLSQL